MPSYSETACISAYPGLFKWQQSHKVGNNVSKALSLGYTAPQTEHCRKRGKARPREILWPVGKEMDKPINGQVHVEFQTLWDVLSRQLLTAKIMMLFPRMTETQGWGIIACVSPVLAYIHKPHLPCQQQKRVIILLGTVSIYLERLTRLSLTVPSEIWAPSLAQSSTYPVNTCTGYRSE